MIFQVNRKRVMAVLYSETVTRMKSLFQQHNVIGNYICGPIVMLRRNCQTAVLLVRKFASQTLFLYTIIWTLMLAATVTVAALSLEMGFSTAISPHMEIAEACSLQSNKASPSCRQCFRLPLDGPRDGLCVPANMFKKSGMDFAVPPIFAALVVTASALFVQGLGLWSY
uniref:Uncharacterized protein n=1 Tax=Physcomitrium patens TaxID=3218 RepID=A0A7I4CV90_PHYPA|nr:uncharacterized protein LOC112278096 isoform X1 [Physcomitrium patens]XP_024366931.1 uncharacterized protein LOC112278096 isoform X1 [Physcomitrium patens]XP_024366932.1 uncharacterized protein LOC112278096 isoform X1 [Physcomitrium patens]XP_024366933.1 uncharacterized protein LOC112278096 isoform X1 [Physcomitrium patens]XP_024366934.1 uncharacterized protein LOC112278096 isoform X1 [Physcomitrium patens]XP_024366935.1 uncharacterized protein LOC112278096 isoform X1 [Physcomitrium patens]|eukprot:XP_024366930.1 uncharacterized protein LOC112278096 isoform X1 [Physcomitrella patens]